MSDVAAASPQVVKTSQPNNAQNTKSSEIESDDDDAIISQKSFIDLILDHLAGVQSPQVTATTSEEISTINSVNFLNVAVSNDSKAIVIDANTTPTKAASIQPSLNIHKTENSLTLLQIALSSQPLDENGNIILNDTAKSTKKIEGQLELTNKIIDQLKNIIPENSEKEGVLSQILTKLQTKSETLEASLSTLESGIITKDTAVEGIPSPILTSLGLTPTEISDISKVIQDLEQKLNREIKVEDLMVGVEGILPPAQTTVLSSIGTQTPKILGSINQNSEPTDDLAGQLNAIDVGSGDEGISDLFTNSKDKSLNKNPEQEGSINSGPTKSTPDQNQEPLRNNTNSNNKDNFTAILNSKNANSGDMIFPANLFGTDIESAIFQQFGMAITPSLSLGTVAQSANIIGTSVMAGQSHPATNLVSAQILKYAPNGNDQTFNLRLDPPELGNVNVRLKFGKENSIKAHITVEKPETYMMLSRDIHALERALQQAGLDTANGSSISFELANQGDNPFNNDGEGAGNNKLGDSAANGQNGQSDDADIIQSSVNWQVDPSSGHVRYNLFV